MAPAEHRGVAGEGIGVQALSGFIGLAHAPTLAWSRTLARQGAECCGWALYCLRLRSGAVVVVVVSSRVGSMRWGLGLS